MAPGRYSRTRYVTPLYFNEDHGRDGTAQRQGEITQEKVSDSASGTVA